MRKFRRLERERKSDPCPLQNSLHCRLSGRNWRPLTDSKSFTVDRPTSRPSPIRPATYRAKPARTYTVPASSFLDNIEEKVRQGHPFWLTSSMSAIIVDVIQKGWRQWLSITSLDIGPEPEPR